MGLLEGGALTGKYLEEGSDRGRLDVEGDRASERVLAIAREVVAVAEEARRTASQVAINWIRQQPGVIIPIVAATEEAQIRDNLACLDFDLTPDQIERLEKAASIHLGFPHSFLGSDHVRELIFGETWARIDNHRA